MTWVRLPQRLLGGRLHEDEAGMTLVEIMVAITVLAVAILGVATTAANGLRTTRNARDRQEGVRSATAALESARAFSYGQLAMRAACSAFTGGADPFATATDCSTVAGQPAFSHDGSDTEFLVLSSTSGIDPYVTTSGRVTTRTYVSWYDDPAITGSTRDAKRVTAVATWQDATGTQREVRQSTVIAEADRGLPVPDFTISPRNISETSIVGTRVCFAHTLTNIGASDRYEMDLANRNGGWTAEGSTVYGKVRTAAASTKHWYVRAFLGDATSVAADKALVYDGDTGTNPDATTGTQLRPDTTGDGFPEFNAQVDTNENTRLEICYSPKAPGSSTTDPVEGDVDTTFSVKVKSQFDATIDEDLTHTIDVTSKLVDLYLRNDGDTTWTPPTQFQMTEEPPTDTTLGNYDTNRDDQPGLFLARASSPVPVVFDFNGWNTLAPMDVAGNAELTLWSAQEDAIDDGETTDTPVSLQIIIRKRTTSGLFTVLHSSTQTYTHGTNTWVSNTWSLPITSTTFQATDFIEVSIGCTNASGDDCLLAFDTTTFASKLRVSAP